MDPSRENSKDLDSNTIISLLSQGNMKILDKVYEDFKPGYLNWARYKFPGLNKEDLVDSWHDAVIAFYEQVSTKKLTSLQCEIKTYLYTIGYRAMIKKHKIMQEIADDELLDRRFLNTSIDYFDDGDDILEEQKAILIKAVNELPQKSKEILMLRFIEGKSLKDIAKAVNYSSLNVLSATISRSLRRLKEIIGENAEIQKHGRKG